MSASPTDLRKPNYTTIENLRPGTKGHTLNVKVIDAKTVLNRPRGPRGAPLKVAECIVGDETGIIVFTARNEQVDQAQVGAYLTLRNAKIDMFRGSMRLACDQWAKIEELSDASFEPKMDNNLSLVEYELVTVDQM